MQPIASNGYVPDILKSICYSTLTCYMQFCSSAWKSKVYSVRVCPFISIWMEWEGHLRETLVCDSVGPLAESLAHISWMIWAGWDRIAHLVTPHSPKPILRGLGWLWRPSDRLLGTADGRPLPVASHSEWRWNATSHFIPFHFPESYGHTRSQDLIYTLKA